MAEAGDEIETSRKHFMSMTSEFGEPTISFQDNVLSISTSSEVSKLFPMGKEKSFNVSAQSAAIANRTDICIYVLEERSAGALGISLSGTFRSSCGIQVNSSNNNALTLTNSGTYDVSNTEVVGNSTITSSGTVVNTPSPNASVKQDPLLGLSGPDTASRPCDFTNVSVASASTTTLSPGTYCGGVTISSSGTVNLLPGEYVFRNGNLQISLSGSLNGDEVMFIFEGSSALSTSASGNVRLSAKRSGPYKGVLMFQQRTGNPNIPYSLSLSGNQLYEGVIYAPRANMNWSISGTQTQPHFMPLIVDELDVSMSGLAQFHIPDDEERLPQFMTATPRLVR